MSVLVAVCDKNACEGEETVRIIGRVEDESDEGLYVVQVNDTSELMARAALELRAPDIIVVERDLGDESGLEVAERLLDQGYAGNLIITAHDDASVWRALDCGANYVVKGRPDFEGRLRRAIKLARGHVCLRRTYAVAISDPAGTRYIPLEQVKFFSVRHHTVNCHWGRGRQIEYSSSLKQVERDYGSRGMVRCHSSYVVNLMHVAVADRKRVWLSDGTSLPIGRAYRKEFRQRLGNSMSERETLDVDAPMA